MTASPRGPRALAWIAVFKFCKALALIVAAFALLHLRDPDVIARWIDWLRMLPLASGHRIVTDLIALLIDAKPETIGLFAAMALAYATLYLVEGVGLWRNAHWAEYLTVISTSALIPIEVWELFHHPTLLKVLALAINLAIVAYLIHLLRRERRAGGHAAMRSAAEKST